MLCTDDNEYSVWQALRSGDSHALLRIGVSLGVGAFLAGVAVASGWVLAVATSRHMADEFVAICVFGASLLWFCALWRIWRRARRAAVLVWPISGTLVLFASTCLGAAIIDGHIHDEEFPIAALVLCSTAATIFIWMPALLRMVRGRPIVRRDNQVNVVCPGCGYSLIGLTELRCPECGARFTIDSLFRAQQYSTLRPPASPDGTAAGLPTGPGFSATPVLTQDPTSPDAAQSPAAFEGSRSASSISGATTSDQT